ncbi:FABP family protein [Actinomyces viscosus]|uniref:FABP family protein n=1 Tax=Actinomyces viscosus TaxID=1656 RepID=UPI0028ECDB36|nr:FABP family protein [Actinomyces viscosus]
MAFTLPDDLAPELYPLAWLVGTWRGYGILTYGETVPEQAVYQEITFDHDGGPYLRQTTTIWTVDATRSKNLDFEMPGLQGASLLAPAQIWSTETAYWRPVGQEQPDGASAAETADAAGEAGASGETSSENAGGPLIPVTQLELVSADPAGHVAVWEGWIQGPRAQVGTQAVGRARTAVAVEEMTRMFGLVGGDLMWTQDMAAFGKTEVTTYASGRLGRVDDLGDPAAQPGSALDPVEPAESSEPASGSAASDDAEPTA